MNVIDLIVALTALYEKHGNKEVKLYVPDRDYGDYDVELDDGQVEVVPAHGNFPAYVRIG